MNIVLTLGRTLRNLSAQKRTWEALMGSAGSAHMKSVDDAAASRLAEQTRFGANPGALRMLTYVPPGLEGAPSALVVVLHGCTQTAAGYDTGAGWSTLADRYGFALLFPEQQPANNPKRCFNWFLPGDTTRGQGEAASIRQMVETMLSEHGIDRRRVFVTGLSAGGAMTSVMLATYPDVFAAGAIVAGLPYGAASNVQEALESMFQGRSRPAREWGDLVRGASPHRGPWPKVSVWHGGADPTVRPLNAVEIIKQWTDVHGLASTPSAEETRDGHPRQVWRSAAGEDVIEFYPIAGMAHGTPLAPGAAENQAGVAGPFLLDVGISSSYHIAKFWGLTDGARRGRAGRPARAEARAAPGPATVPEGRPTPVAAAAAPPRGTQAGTAPRGARTDGHSGASASHGRRVGSVAEVINKALKAAGLMR